MVNQGHQIEDMNKELLVVYDSKSYDGRLLTAWGLSCLIRLGQKVILFDTGGDSTTLLYNLRQLGVDPGGIDAVVLSHIHDDHVGGLIGFLRQYNKATVYLPNSFPQTFKDRLTTFGVKIVETGEAKEILPEVYAIGDLNNEISEQSLVIISNKGPVIVTGCAHCGVVNIVKMAQEVVPCDRVQLVVGGFHLLETSSTTISSIIETFDKLGVEKIAPCHCTGDKARRIFRERYGRACIESGVGRRIQLA